MQFGFWRHLCSKILGKKQSKENVCNWVRLTAGPCGSGRMAPVEQVRLGRTQPSPRVPGHLDSLGCLVSHSLSFILFVSFFLNAEFCFLV